MNEPNIQDAREEAERIVKKAKAQAALIQQQAYQAGMKQGQAKSLELLFQLNQQYEHLDTLGLQETVKVAASIAKKVIQTELSQSPENIQRMAKEALDKVKRSPRVWITVHPEDEAQMNEWVEHSASPHSISISANESFERGDCVVSSQLGRVDARIETQIRNVEKALSSASLKFSSE